jgi:hypothetical protein
MTQECRHRPLRGSGAAGVSLSRRYPQYSDNRAGGHVVPINAIATPLPLVTPERLAELIAILAASVARRAAEARP